VWRDAGDTLRDARIKAALQQQAQQGAAALVKNGGGHMSVGETIEFRTADIVSPDGRLLVCARFCVSVSAVRLNEFASNTQTKTILSLFLGAGHRPQLHRAARRERDGHWCESCLCWLGSIAPAWIRSLGANHFKVPS
jgi:hypothetical protein